VKLLAAVAGAFPAIDDHHRSAEFEIIFDVSAARTLLSLLCGLATSHHPFTP
jgi:hypothetical protein